jgi:formate dehydrogenase assembly factor FdhD
MPHVPDHLLTNKERHRRRALAAELEDTLSLLRALGTRQDFFVGYSLSEAISDRIEEIGTMSGDDVHGLKTICGELQAAKKTGLAAIDAAIASEESLG